MAQSVHAKLVSVFNLDTCSDFRHKILNPILRWVERHIILCLKSKQTKDRTSDFQISDIYFKHTHLHNQSIVIIIKMGMHILGTKISLSFRNDFDQIECVHMRVELTNSTIKNN